ncbi:MAG: hypothetical protein HKP16_06565 [Xanthomonadales bacterium]|nr:hypothetical protein [Xanthomonadales bacterium]
MKKTLLISMLVLLGALGFTVNAQAAECSDVIWSAEMLADNPNIGDACLGVVEKRGAEAVKLRARVVRQGVNSTIVQWQLPDGSWSAAQRRFPERGATAEIGGQNVRITDLAARQEVNIYIPMAGNWSMPTAAPAAAAAAAAAAPAAAAAAAAAPPPPPPAPEPEPEPMALPATATQLPMLALLGGLMLLMGGMIGLVRTRL